MPTENSPAKSLIRAYLTTKIFDSVPQDRNSRRDLISLSYNTLNNIPLMLVSDPELYCACYRVYNNAVNKIKSMDKRDLEIITQMAYLCSEVAIGKIPINLLSDKNNQIELFETRYEKIDSIEQKLKEMPINDALRGEFDNISLIATYLGQNQFFREWYLRRKRITSK